MMNKQMTRNKQAGFGSTQVIIIVAGIILFCVGRFAMSGDAFKPALLEGIDLHLGETVTSIGIFLAMAGLVGGMFTKPLAEAIQERTDSLEKTFTEAENLKKQMDAMKAEYEGRLAETESNARAQIQAEVKKAQEIRTQIQAEASAKADEMLKKAQEEIASERAKALVDMRVHVATLSLMATEKILGENMDSDKNRKLVDEFIDKVEVPNA